MCDVFFRLLSNGRMTYRDTTLSCSSAADLLSSVWNTPEYPFKAGWIHSQDLDEVFECNSSVFACWESSSVTCRWTVWCPPNVLWHKRPDQYVLPITYCYNPPVMHFRNDGFFILINLRQLRDDFFLWKSNMREFLLYRQFVEKEFMIFLVFPKIFIVRAEVCRVVLLLWAYVQLDQYTPVITYQQSISQGFAAGLLVTFMLPWVGSVFLICALIFIQLNTHVWKLHSHNLNHRKG